MIVTGAAESRRRRGDGLEVAVRCGTDWRRQCRSVGFEFRRNRAPNIMLQASFVGLPNIGKTTLFNAVTAQSSALIANYAFSTSKPNVGVVAVPDERLGPLAKVVKTEKIVPATVEFVDIAGLVRGSSQGEGIGNQFLHAIRETATMIHVVRWFYNESVP